MRAAALLTLLALVTVLMLAAGVIVAVGTSGFVDTSRQVADARQTLETLERAYAAVRDAESAQRGYLLTGDESFYRAMQQALPPAAAEAATLRRLVLDDAVQVARAERFMMLVEERLHAMAELAITYRLDPARALAGAASFASSQQAKRPIASLRDEMVEHEQARAAALEQRFDRLAPQLTLGVTAAQGISLLLLLGVAWKMIGEARQRIRAERGLVAANAELRRSNAEMQQAGDRTRELTRYAGMLQSCRSPAEAMRVTADAMHRLLPAVGGALYLARASRNLLERMADWGDPAAPSAETLVPDECWALRRGQPFAVDDVREAMHCAHLDPVPSQPACSVCVPLTAQGDTIGFLHLSQPSALDAADLDVACGAAEQLALALSNLRLQESLHTQSVRDPLTGLFNRRYLEESLEREMARCGRRGQPLSVLMLDVDHFKRFNDSHGHDGGDALLARLGTLLKALCRTEDVACRYGGEEFTVILPEASREIAGQRAEMIREAIAGLRVTHARRPLPPVTASIGVATFPHDGGAAADVVSAADHALYRAKREGRDRVAFARADDTDHIDAATNAAENSQPLP